MSNAHLDHTVPLDPAADATASEMQAMTPAIDSADPAPPVAKPARGPIRKTLRAFAYVVLVGLLLFTARAGHRLWLEYQDLQEILSHDVEHQFIGFVDIHPNPSRARPPQHWFVEDEHTARLWAGWRGKAGHTWFEFRPGEIDPAQLSGPFGGRDAYRPIDVPLVEIGGGEVWNRIPDEHRVVAFRWAGTNAIYPMMVLEQVIVINDVIDNHPLLIVHNCAADARGASADAGAVAIVDGTIDGRRVLFAHCGFQINHAPLLFDRETESLWTPTSEGVRALAGARKGTTLPHLDVQPRFAAWSDARAARARLLVGAERPAPVRYATDAVPVHYHPPAPTGPQDNIQRTSTNLTRSIP